jgi:predicted nucleic acid-binding protein
MERHPDLTLSFTDCVGAVTATEGRAAAVFGLDNDFRVLGFTLEP